jgi:hypothetical protein
MKRITANFLTLVLLAQLAPAVLAKPKGNWNSVKELVKTSISVRTKIGGTYYGLVQSVDDDAITLQLAGKEDFTPQEVVFRRDDIEKVWRAKLRFAERNIAKGALIGAGVGLGAALITALLYARNHEADAAIGVGAFPFYGAGIGAIAGIFWKKKHKKQELIYSI